MSLFSIAIIASAFNVGTIYCIRMCAYKMDKGDSAILWCVGIAVTILVTQFLVVKADMANKPVGLMVATLVTFVMIAAALFDIDKKTGEFSITAPWTMPWLKVAGFLLAIIGVICVGISEQRSKERELQEKRNSTLKEGPLS